MMYFDPKTDLLEYQDGAYLCDGKHGVEGPLDLEILSQAVGDCPKLQVVALD